MAINAFNERQLLLPSFRWQDVWQAEHQRAFAVAGVGREDVLAIFRDALDAKFAEAWHRFAPVVAGWVDVVTHEGPDALREVWLEVLAGRAVPRIGHVLVL